ncbi:exporter of polyketide antibiotics [Microbacterium hatanonis]
MLLVERMRRDALQLTLWVVGTAALAGAAVAGVAANFDTAEERTSLVATALANPVILLFRGLPSGTGQGAFITFLILPFLAMLSAFTTSFLAVRHTRAAEESGLAELTEATPAGRVLPTVATVVHGVIASLLLGAATTLALVGCGLEPGGSLLVGASCASIALVFLGVGLAAAQFLRTSRAANSVSVTALLVTFFAAGLGNALGTPSDDLQRMQSSPLTWFSPFGWAENTRAFDENLALPLLWCMLLAAVLIAVSFALLAQRDTGSSLVAERPGRPAARAALASTTALVARLSWPATVAWMIGGFASGALATALAPAVSSITAQNPAIAQVLAQISAGGEDLARGLVVVFFTMIGILAACAGVQTVARARQEESHGTAELVRALPTGRVRWLADFVVVGFAAIVLTVFAAVVGATVGVGMQGGDGALIVDAVVVGAGQAVAAGVFVGLTALVFTVLPRATIAVGWTLVLLAAVLGLFGPVLGLPDWAVDLAPFSVTPVPTDAGVDQRGLIWLTIAIVASVAASAVLMRRRELASAG